MTFLMAAACSLAVSFVQACKNSAVSAAAAVDAGLEAAPATTLPEAEATQDMPADAAPEAGVAAPPAALPRPSGPPAAGRACAAKDAKEASACAPGGFEELLCANGAWKVAQICRGPGGCKAEAAGVHCDPGAPVAGDPCAATAVPRCANVHTVFACKNGSWETSLCVPPGKCVSNAKNGVAGCK